MTSSESSAVDRSFAEAMSDLIALVQEAKQALWAGPRGEAHVQLEELQAWLMAQIDMIDDAEQQGGGRPANFVYPSGRTRPNILAKAGNRPNMILLMLTEHLSNVIGDLRGVAEALQGSAERSLFVDLADELDRRRDSLLSVS